MGRSTRSLDVSKWDDLVAEAAEAFGTDVGYAVKMIHNARAVVAKRKLWETRCRYRALVCEGTTWNTRHVPDPAGWSIEDAIETLENAPPRPKPRYTRSRTKVIPPCPEYAKDCPKPREGKGRGRRFVSPEDRDMAARIIHKLKADGYTPSAISVYTGLSTTTIQRL